MNKKKLEKIWEDYPCFSPLKPMRWYDLLLSKLNIAKYFDKLLKKGAKRWYLFKGSHR